MNPSLQSGQRKCWSLSKGCCRKASLPPPFTLTALPTCCHLIRPVGAASARSWLFYEPNLMISQHSNRPLTHRPSVGWVTLFLIFYNFTQYLFPVCCFIYCYFMKLYFQYFCLKVNFSKKYLFTLVPCFSTAWLERCRSEHQQKLCLKMLLFRKLRSEYSYGGRNSINPSNSVCKFSKTWRYKWFENQT